MHRFKHLLAIMLVLCAAPAYAQTEKAYFNDTFSDNSHSWSEENTASSYCKVVNGHYELQHKTASGGYIFNKTFNSEYGRDFYLETQLMQTYGQDNDAFGLMWLSGGGNDLFDFLISSNGYFRVGEFSGGNFTAQKDWTYIGSSINGKYNYNTLAVKRTGNYWYFYVNGNMVHSMYELSAKGHKFGFHIKGENTVKANYFKFEYERKSVTNALPPQGYVKESLGKNVNTEYSDKVPVISHDGQTLYFSRKSDPRNKGADTEDAWVSNVLPSGDWGLAYNMGFPINNDGHNFVISVSPDNNTLLVGNTYNSDGSANSKGISLSYRTRTGWSVPEKVTIEDYYNDHQYVNFCLAPNRKVLVMAVERSDSYGDQDLYVSFLRGDNTWSKPKNMGAVVNTKGGDFSPFIAADGQTMYFASDGHPGYGSADIFMTKRLDESWTRWSTPVNLGSELNTEEWDAYFTIPASGNYAYLVSDKNTLGSLDIFRVKIAEDQLDEVEEPSRQELMVRNMEEPVHAEAIEADVHQEPKKDPVPVEEDEGSSIAPNPVVVIYGKVYDASTKAPLGAGIFYEDLDKNAELGIASSNPVTGDYKIILPYGQRYGFRAEAEKHASVSEHIDITQKGNYIEIEQDLYLVPLEIGKTVLVNNVFFVRSKPELLPTSYPELDRLVDLLKTNPSLEIRLEGHTDGIGEPGELMRLSWDRAKAVKEYLISKGIAAARLSEQGYGRNKPVAPNNTEENRKKNRRVEFVITKI